MDDIAFALDPLAGKLLRLRQFAYVVFLLPVYRRDLVDDFVEARRVRKRYREIDSYGSVGCFFHHKEFVRRQQGIDVFTACLETRATKRGVDDIYRILGGTNTRPNDQILFGRFRRWRFGKFVHVKGHLQTLHVRKNPDGSLLFATKIGDRRAPQIVPFDGKHDIASAGRDGIWEHLFDRRRIDIGDYWAVQQELGQPVNVGQFWT